MNNYGEIADGCWSSATHEVVLSLCSAFSLIIIALLLIMGDVLENQKVVDMLIITIVIVGWGTLVYRNQLCLTLNHNKTMRALIASNGKN